LGCGVKKNDNKALALYMAASLNGDVMALHEVARCFYYGIGTAKDRKIAEVWYDMHSKKNQKTSTTTTLASAASEKPSTAKRQRSSTETTQSKKPKDRRPVSS
jgi:hypothetical protein